MIRVGAREYMVQRWKIIIAARIYCSNVMHVQTVQTACTHFTVIFPTFVVLPIFTENSPVFLFSFIFLVERVYFICHNFTFQYSIVVWRRHCNAIRADFRWKLSFGRLRFCCFVLLISL